MGQQNIQANIKVDSKRSARKHILVATQVTVRNRFFFVAREIGLNAFT